MQHNLWKAKRILSLLVKVSLYSMGGSILLINISSFLGKSSDTLMTLISIISLIVLSLWNLFDKKLWKLEKIYRWLPVNFSTPNISGRWEGSLIRESKVSNFVLEITQTFTHISCNTFSFNSYSKSELAELLYNESDGTYRLVYIWKGKTKNNPYSVGATNEFSGTTILNITMNPMKLVGCYYTDREPCQTKGELKFEVRQETLKNSF